MPIRMLLSLFLMFLAGTVFAENCTVTKKTCLQGPETRIIDGARYILIRAEEGVEVNGVQVCIAPER